MQDQPNPCQEPTLKEILSDAIVEAMMEADRVDPYELEAMLTEVARNREHGMPFQPSGELATSTARK
jgi:hypothetical protein